MPLTWRAETFAFSLTSFATSRALTLSILPIFKNRRAAVPESRFCLSVPSRLRFMTGGSSGNISSAAGFAGVIACFKSAAAMSAISYAPPLSFINLSIYALWRRILLVPIYASAPPKSTSAFMRSTSVCAGAATGSMTERVYRMMLFRRGTSRGVHKV